MKKIHLKTDGRKGAAIEEISYDSVRTLLLAERYPEAEEQIRRILARWPQHLQALNDLGVLYSLRGEKEEAAKQFIAATRNDQTDRVAIHNLLGSLLRMGRRDDAIATLKFAMETAAGQSIADIADEYLAVLTGSKEIPGPLFHFMKPGSRPLSPQGTAYADGSAIMGRVACLGKDALQFIRFSSNGSINSYNLQKGRVDLFLDVLRGGQKPKASVLEPFMERRDVYPLIVEQQDLSWTRIREKVQLLVMDSFAELTDQQFTHRTEGWSFCSHYTDLIHNEAFEAMFENKGPLPLDGLAQAYWDFFTWFETRYPEAHVVYIHFPTKLDSRTEFKERGEAIRDIMAAIANTKPYILNIDVDDSLVDGNENDQFPYHFSRSTAKAIADRWIRLEDNRSGPLQERAMKTACVVQGDIRRGTVEVLNHVARHFDVVILSTWKSDEQKVPQGVFKLILNDKPHHYGATNRNMQRRTASAGISLAESLGCSHVMKLRTDMLPTRLDLQKMLKWTHFNVPDGIPSRIVTCAFRNITVEPDWFSSIPDLFSFGTIEMMKLLWGDSGFNYSLEMNIPRRMTEQCGLKWQEDPNACGIFCAESELYAIFKDRLETRFNTPLNHTTIAKRLLYLIDHESLGMCWFHPENGFRSIMQALEYPWWTEQVWRTRNPVVCPPGYPVTEEGFRQGQMRTLQAAQAGIGKQHCWYDEFSQPTSRMQGQ
jgi:tetratricopeptide (TPR) repeat protein